MNIDIKLPSSTVSYWSSVRRQEGVDCNIQNCSFRLTYSLQLIPYNDGLTRRPRSDWKMSSCEGTLNGLEAYTCIKINRELEMVSVIYILIM